MLACVCTSCQNPPLYRSRHIEWLPHIAHQQGADLLRYCFCSSCLAQAYCLNIYGHLCVLSHGQSSPVQLQIEHTTIADLLGTKTSYQAVHLDMLSVSLNTN